MTDTVDILQKILLWGPGILFAITLHEWAHGYVASRFGDPTPGMMGRLTLNPLPHIDWVWTVLVPIVLLYTVGFAFGGAKPVPINPRYFRGSFRVALFWVSVAGPLMNLFLATACALAARMVVQLPPFFSMPLFNMFEAAIVVNVVLAVFNLFPVPPLDGGRVVAVLLPPSLSRYWSSLDRYGLVLVVILAMSGILGKMINPVAGWFLTLFVGMAGST
ncbi:MAG: site-2 protease family protein [Magnetococcales bacterium]|nr:site-2 protease family protein [Magnetococcales bacterium]MBF0323322.1 site-2 protease family protein [Magnetococcales bacterium]